MPKVSQQYRDARRAQILDAARRCFLRQGFHETSMHDLFVESGLSSGAVYRYFASKDDVILAVAEENMAEVVTLVHSFATGEAAGGLGDAVARVLDTVRAKHESDGIGAIALHVWSEAARKPALAQRFRTILQTMRADLAAVVAGQQQLGGVPEQASAEAVAVMIMSIVPGYILQLALFGPDDVAGLPAAARALWP